MMCNVQDYFFYHQRLKKIYEYIFIDYIFIFYIIHRFHFLVINI